ncbi:hypothetical protein PIB30_049147 [Stylosanthes scabra]|uniref:PB1-like domain-containing protein n=1 Tax=Stylosanthes scabra TaxID=79078 RepID=A0ABU6ZFZ9_9FABA|nr:hypothetical protein [Stylosanthes scabra]
MKEASSAVISQRHRHSRRQSTSVVPAIDCVVRRGCRVVKSNRRNLGYTVNIQGYNEYDYMYWLDEEMGLKCGGLNMITGDLAVVMMGNGALNHESLVHVYFEHPIDRAVEVHVLDDDSNRVQPQPTPKEDIPKKMKRVKTRAKRTPTPKKKALSRNSRKIGQASQNFLHKLSDPITKTQPISQ